ncbi:hypothetical protein FSP39_005329 [Pinctada imbricata]|uniref:PNT domain-containing protein n=1 Tax=Pinctada imbricata TaxID=66713 RepID=A0AA88YH91_PINIB|nr:hypothetical protein FSP39_005329 [Pinctada imbricata]
MSLHPQNWTVVEVTNWLEYVTTEYKMDHDVTSHILESFQSISGQQLLRMKLEDFKEVTTVHAETIFEAFKSMCNYDANSGLPLASLLPPITEHSRNGSPSSMGSNSPDGAVQGTSQGVRRKDTDKDERSNVTRTGQMDTIEI